MSRFSSISFFMMGIVLVHSYEIQIL
jgi:hypothetical protein